MENKYCFNQTTIIMTCEVKCEANQIKIYEDSSIKIRIEVNEVIK